VLIAPKLTSLALLSLFVAFSLSQSLPRPAAATTASPVHGARLFVESGCAHCHGPAGSGGDRGPDLKDIGRRMTVAKMTTQIHDGGQSMPPFGDVLAPQDITDVVAYLRAKRKPSVPATPSIRPTPE
jgi:mono/diheme cytochrome c family protein